MLKALLCAAVFTAGLTAHAQVTRYEKELVRRRMLALTTEPAAKLVIEGTPKSAREAEFLKFYESTIFPKLQWELGLEKRYRAYALLRDSGSHNSEKELEQWTAQIDKIIEEDNAHMVDPKWTAALKQWAELSQGLDGDLPRMARAMHKARDLEAFSEDMKPKMDEMERLAREVSDVRRNTQAGKFLPEFMTTLQKARRDFKSGVITLDEGMKLVRELHNRGGHHAVGYEVAQKAGDKLTRIAQLRTELAQSKGFKTWADYRLQVSGQGYTEEYRGSENQRRFLTEYLTELAKVRDLFVSQRLKALNLEHRRDEFRFQDWNYLTPPGIEMLQPYFPNEAITSIWEKTLIENGFKPEELKQIYVDDEFRDGKNQTEAYLSGIQGPYNDTLVVRAGDLSYAPVRRGKTELKPGIVYILQSWKNSGVRDLTTAFHEGGHATEKLLKFKIDRYLMDEAYGYVEVPSIMSEKMAHSAQMLYDNAVPIDGKKPDLKVFEEYVNAFLRAEIVNDMIGASQALFDLELWSIDYTAPGAPSFVEAIKQVSEATDQWSNVFPDLETDIPMYFNNLSTGHFSSGNVRYIGYIYAGIAAEMMADFISDELERETGRRDWYRQPSFAKIYGDRFVSEAWKTQFPTNIERITGRKFDPGIVAEEYLRLISQCEDGLKSKP